MNEVIITNATKKLINEVEFLPFVLDFFLKTTVVIIRLDSQCYLTSVCSSRPEMANHFLEVDETIQ